MYYHPASHQVLFVNVLNGSGIAVLVATGSCASTFENYSTIPGNVVDSSTMASSVWNAGGSSFVSAHSNETFNLAFALLGGGKSCVLTAGPCWVVEYTPCDPATLTGPAGSQPVFYALVNATTGAVIAALPSSSTCASSGVTSSLATLGPSDGSTRFLAV